MKEDDTQHHLSNIWKIFQLGDKIKKFFCIKSRSVCSKEIRVIFFYIQTPSLLAFSGFVLLTWLANNHDQGSRFLPISKVIVLYIGYIGGIFNIYYLLDI